MNESPPVIRLANGDGSLEIALAGWQCPGKTSGDGAYCVNVDGKVRHDRGDWQFHGRFCRISHLWCLADWLDAVAEGEKPKMCLIGGFLCHDLVFQVYGGSYNPNEYEEEFSPLTPGIFRMTFGGNTHPPWSSNEWGYMDFPIAGSDLRAMAAELREQLRILQPL